MKACVEIELVVGFYGVVDEGARIEELSAGTMVDLNFPKTVLGDLDSDSIDASFGDAHSLVEIPEDELDFYGLEISDDTKAIKFEQPVFFEIELEIDAETDQRELLDSIDLDWDIFNEDFELETESPKVVKEFIRFI